MNAATLWTTTRRLRALSLLAVLLIAGFGAAPTSANWAAAQTPDDAPVRAADQRVRAAQAGRVSFIPMVTDTRPEPPRATAWLRPSQTQLNPNQFFGMTVLTKSTGGSPEPFVNVFVTWNTGLVDFQSSTTDPGDFVSTQSNGVTVHFNGPLVPGQERYATLLLRVRSGVTSASIPFFGTFGAASGSAGSLPVVTVDVGSTPPPPVQFACLFGRGGSGPLGQNPSDGNLPFGTEYTFGAFRQSRGGCGYTFQPDARVSYWVAQPTGPSVPLNIYGYANQYGEVLLRYNTRPLMNNCPVNLCAFAMNASSDNSYVLVAPFNSTRPPLSSVSASAAQVATVPPSVAAAPPVQASQTAQVALGGLQGRVTGVGGVPLENVLVEAVNPATDQVINTAQTDVNGLYVMPAGLPSGDYAVYFVASLGHDEENEDTYVDKVLTATVTEPEIATLDAVLDPGAPISGRVTAADTGAGIAEMVVVVYDATMANVVSVALSDANGEYTTDPLASGNYVVEFNAPLTVKDVSTGYIGEYNGDQQLGATPTPVTVTVPTPLAGVNAQLARSIGAIDGVVTAQDGGGGLTDVTVVVRNAANGQQVAIDDTDETGRYHISLPTGSYTVEFFTDVAAIADTRAYLDRFATPNAIAVTSPAVTGNINAVLARGGQFGGRVTAKDGGVGLDEVFVVVTDNTQQVVTTTFTEEDGTFATPALPPGTYNLTFDPTGSRSEISRDYKPGTRTATLGAPGSRIDNSITLSK